MVQYGATARRAAMAVATVTLAVLLLRLSLDSQETGSIPGALASMSQFFTILTNTLVLIVMALLAAGGGVSARGLLATVAAILGVGIVYHAVLAQLWEPQGWVYVADHGVHSVVPLSTLLWWLVFAEKRGLRFQDAAYCVVWPLVYCGYILFRASFSGVYPYPFLDMAALGTTAVLLNILGLTVGFAVLGLLLVFVGRVVGAGSRRTS